MTVPPDAGLSGGADDVDGAFSLAHAAAKHTSATDVQMVFRTAANVSVIVR